MTSRVTFVCSGNICRSPLAEYLARSVFPDSGIEFASVGTHAEPGLSATLDMIRVGDELGVDLRPHRSRHLSESVRPDVFFCMERHHVDTCETEFPGMAPGSIRLVGDRPVTDPYGRGTDRYDAVGRQIHEAIVALDL